MIRRSRPGRPATARRPTGKPPAAGPESVSDVRLGVRLKHTRMARGLRLKDVADRARCSESLVSKIENDKVVPSLHVLHRISEALGLTFGELFSKSNEPNRVVSRAGERPVVLIDSLRQGIGIEMERLIPYGPEHLLQGNIHVVAPGGGSEGTLRHSGEEVGYVIEGRIELTVGDQTYRLETGDSFTYRSELPHGYRNTGSGLARILFVNTPPTY